MDHERRCHDAVRRSVADLASCRRVVVLGSGLLQDVPLGFLAARFDRVTLVDAVHLLPSRIRARWAGATLVACDLTGLFGSGGERRDPLSHFRSDPALDLVISANLLSQLPMAVEDSTEFAPEDRIRLADGVVRWHLADLAALSCRVCLLTDVERRELRRDGSAVETQDLLRGAALPAPDESWDWPVAPFGEMARDRVHLHRVYAYPDFRATG